MRIIYLFIILFIFGCSSNHKIERAVPEWFFSVPKSKTFFYGVGEGYSLREAKNRALTFIASEINTKISSQLLQETTLSDNQLYREIKEKIKSSVDSIDFNNVIIEKSVQKGDKVFVLVKVNKENLFKHLKLKFEMLDKTIDNEIKIAQNFSILKQVLILKRVTPKIQEALSQIMILNNLNLAFPIQKYQNKYISYLNRKRELIDNLSFNIKVDDEFSKFLLSILNRNGYKVNKNSDINIIVEKNIQIQKIMGLYVAKALVTIRVISNNNTLKTTIIKVKGVANSKEEAERKAAITFKNRIEEIGIDKILGF